MTTNHGESSQNDFNLVYGGLSAELAARLGLAGETPSRRFFRVAVVLLITWVPLALLTLVSGDFSGKRVAVPFLHDPEVHARLLFVLPLLELAQMVVAVSLSVQVRHLRQMGVVPVKELPRFDAARAEVLKLRGSVWADVVILILAYGLALVLRLAMGFSEGASSWDRTATAPTIAGWWHMLVSLPLVYYFLIRWVWIFTIWSLFLYRVARLDLELTATHPDRTGGLGFLAWGLACFATVLIKDARGTVTAGNVFTSR